VFGGFMLYLLEGELFLMRNNQYTWQNWIAVLQTWGFHEFAATLIEATDPINFIGAQAVYLGQPVLNVFFSEEQVNALAELLDNPMATKSFVKSLRQQNQVIDN
jgi:hypothetical protein